MDRRDRPAVVRFRGRTAAARSRRHARTCRTAVRLGRGPLSHVPTVKPALVAGIHGIGGTFETLKTWMAGTTPGHDANGDDLAGRVPVVEATRKRRKSATFPRPRQRSTGQQCTCRGHPRNRRNAWDSKDVDRRDRPTVVRFRGRTAAARSRRHAHPRARPGDCYGHPRNQRSARDSKDVDRRDGPGDDAKNGGSANRVPRVSATRKRRKSAAISHRRQRLTGQPWVKPGDDRNGDGLADRVTVAWGTRNRRNSAPFFAPTPTPVRMAANRARE